MTTRAPISMCLIFRDDPMLEQAVASVRPYVKQVCIVVDSDAPAESIARVKKLADAWSHVPWIDDFSATRNECLRLASEHWAAWMDSDDVVEGAEYFEREIEAAKLHTASGQSFRGRLLAPYSYQHDARTGEVVRQQWRERIVPNDGTWVWEHPTHEGLVKKNGVAPVDPGHDYWMRGVRWVHKRTETGARSRSLAILEKWHAAGHDDAWTHVNLGFELHAANRYAEAIAHFAQHVEKCDWAEERALACLRAGECAMAIDFLGRGEYSEAASWVKRAIALRPDDFEPRFAWAQLCLVRGQYSEALANCALALAAPETRTPIGRNPQLRAYEAHELMRSAAEIEQDWGTAKAATEKILEARPGSPPHLLALKRYKAALLVESFEPKKATIVEIAKVALADPKTREEMKELAAETGGEFIPGRDHMAPYEDSIRYEEKKTVHRELRREGDRYVVELEPGDTFTMPEELGAVVEIRPPTPKANGTRVPLPSGPKGEVARGLAIGLGLNPDDVKRTSNFKIIPHPGMPKDAFAVGPDADGKWHGGQLPPATWNGLPFPQTPIAAPQPPLEIVFMCGPGSDPWNPDIVERLGAGGSETAVVEVAKRLAKLGHKVRVFNWPGEEGTYGGVDYEAWTPVARPKCDVLVAWRMAALLPQADAKVRLMWCHDTEAIGMNYGYSLLVDRFLALSKWHKDNLVKVHGIPESQVFQTRNGIDLALYEGSSVRNPQTAIYCSSPDRGLGALLDMWPAIRERVPRAQLDVFYSFANWEKQANAAKNEQHRFLCATLKRRMKELAPMGVEYHGLVNRKTLTTHMRTSGAWLYPTWFPETSCMAAMEARAAGMRIVATPTAALEETIGPYGALVDGDWLSDSFFERFVDASVRALTLEGLGDRNAQSRIARETLGWDGVARDWEKLFRELLGAAKHGALPAYREYRLPEVTT